MCLARCGSLIAHRHCFRELAPHCVAVCPTLIESQSTIRQTANALTVTTHATITGVVHAWVDLLVSGTSVQLCIYNDTVWPNAPYVYARNGNSGRPGSENCGIRRIDPAEFRSPAQVKLFGGFCGQMCFRAL